MNELQVRLSADISALQSALTKAKATIKSFESETAKESEKGNVGFKRKIGLIEELTAKSRLLKTALSQATNEAQVKSYNKELEKTSKEIARLTSLGKMVASPAIQKTLGIIGQLEKKAKDLRVALSSATDENDIARYNQALEDTSKELTRLNSLGRSVTANLGSVGGGFSKVQKEGKGAVGVTQEFNRIIQDAPFGLIGVGNNLQQLATNFGTLRSQAGSTGKAVGLALSSIISPVNLGLLAVSALTAGFTAYQMGSLDFIFGTEEAEKAVVSLEDKLSDYIDTLGSVEKANINASKAIATERIEVDALVGVIENESETREKRLLAINKLRDMYPGYLKGLDDETILSQGLRDVYIQIADAITKRATALALEDELVRLAKERLELNSKLIKDEDNFFKIQTELIKAQTELDRLEEKRANGQASASRVALAEKERDNLLALLNTSQELAVETEKGLITNKEAAGQLGNEYQNIYGDLLEINSLTSEWEAGTEKVIRTYEKMGTTLDKILERSRDQRRDDFFSGVESGDDGIGIESGKATTQGVIIPDDVQKGVTDNLKEQKSLVDELSGAYAGLGSLIGKAFDNAPFGQFLGTFIAFAAKMVAANFKIAASNAISGASNAALATGPAAPISLPAFIAGSLGVVAAAFAAIGGGGKSASVGGGGGGSMGSGRAPQIFTNAQAPSIPASSSPTPSGSIDFDRAQGRLTTTVTGEDISFVYDRYQERKRGGG